MTTVIRGKAVLGYDGRQHVLIQNGVVVFDGPEIVYVGDNWQGAPPSSTMDFSDSLILPGFINLHSHTGIEAGGRLILDAGRPDVFGSGYMNYWTTAPGKTPIHIAEDAEIGALHHVADCVRHGSTTIVDVGGGTDALVRAAARLGARVYCSPGYASGRYVDSDGEIRYDWREDSGLGGLDRATAFIQSLDGDPLVSGILCPHAVDTCRPELLRATAEAAEDLNVPIQIHAAQGLFEYTELVRRSGKTPVAWLSELGFLSSRVILGHAIFLDSHSMAPSQGSRDVGILQSSGVHVAHCPLVFARRGIALESFQRYVNAGINVGIGTDTSPRDIIDEMRWASYLSKLADHDLGAGHPRDVVAAATLGGARALGRSDLGRLATGAKADIVTVPLENVRMSPVLDPISSLVHFAGGRGVAHVFVGGRHVVAEGSVLGLDEHALAEAAQSEASLRWEETPNWDSRGRTALDFSPPAFPSAGVDL